MIDFKNVTKVYPNGTVALKNINLHIDEGEFVFIVGVSGAGKTTLMKMLLKEEVPTDGTVTVDKYTLNTLPTRKIPYYRRNIGMVFQDFKLFEKSTVYENVAFAMRAIGQTKSVIRTRVPKLLKIVGLQNREDSFPHQLSGGEQQRTALARAIANNPKIVIADEPTSSVDYARSHEIMKLLLELNHNNRTVIVITHDLSFVNSYGKRVIELRDGEIASDGIREVEA